MSQKHNIYFVQIYVPVDWPAIQSLMDYYSTPPSSILQVCNDYIKKANKNKNKHRKGFSTMHDLN
jgi:hypothetical protein